MKHVVIAALALIACDRGEHRAAREKYNDGVALLAKSDFEGAEKALLDARSGAGVDPELRFRAAYDLGFAYDAHAQATKTGKNADLSKALELEDQAVTWFSDAARLKKDDTDTVENLAIVRARAQALSDELARGEGKLEKRLDKVLKEQRGVLEEARGAWIAIKTAGGTDPLAQQATLTRLADQERGIVAEVGVIGDLSADEIDGIGKKAEDKRTQDERVRVVQLHNLDVYINDARTKIAEARRKLQDLAAEDGVARAEAALVTLKRAREQLLDPITVLREVARDELDLLQETHAVAEAKGGSKKLQVSGAGSATALDEPAKLVPAWMEPPALGERQGGVHDRVDEVRARLAATIDSVDKPVGQGSAAEPPKLTPEQAKMIEQLRVALPLVTEAAADMDHARADLGEAKLDSAATAQRDALIALAKAIEYFADLKQTIEIAHGTQQQLVGLLSPEAAAKLPAAERASQTKDDLAQNITRLDRIKELLGDEVAKLDKQGQELEAKAAAGAGSGSGAPDPKQVEAAKQQLAQAKQQMAAAEVYRADAAKALGELDGALRSNKDPLTPAKTAATKIEELRKIFFTVIEHLQQLLRDQNETKDQTSQANGEDDFTRAPKLPGLAGHQDEHGQMAKAITDALAKQADAGAKGQGEQQEQAKAFAAAAAEVRLAQTDMGDAKTTLGKAADPKATQSMSLKPAVDSQTKAIEHLENALKLLQPPPKDDQKQDKDKQDQQQQQAKQDKKKEPQQQQGGAGQRARDEDAKRQRDKQKPNASDAVDQDW
jgi:hypothetical protein